MPASGMLGEAVSAKVSTAACGVSGTHIDRSLTSLPPHSSGSPIPYRILLQVSNNLKSISL